MINELVAFLQSIHTGMGGNIFIIVGFLVAIAVAVWARSLIAFILFFGLTLILRFLPDILRNL